jgi:uncharacterized protein YecE (DUF72 family)
MSQTTGTFRCGCSGYQYDHWRGVLYDGDLPKSQWFDRYADVFDTVEINNTFYHLPKASTFKSWSQAGSDDFLYVLKFSRYGTHMKKLKDPEDTIGLFLERAEIIGERLGPILVQLPPNWRANVDRLGAFLDAAPDRHRWAVEFRNPDWLQPAVFEVLRNHNAALCIHDLIDEHPWEVTADWLYLRFHGPAGGDTGYSHQALTGSAGKINNERHEGRDVYAYFNNDVGGHAVRDAQDLRRYVENEMSQG